jgi:hypothetical protein
MLISTGTDIEPELGFAVDRHRHLRVSTIRSIECDVASRKPRTINGGALGSHRADEKVSIQQLASFSLDEHRLTI